MPKSIVSVELFCVQCNEFTEHIVTYKGERMESVKCQQCEREIVMWYDKPFQPLSDHGQHVYHHNLRKLYSRRFLDRILTKPRRMEEELASDLSVFLVTLPLRIITKPVRLLQEVFLTEDDESKPKS